MQAPALQRLQDTKGHKVAAETASPCVIIVGYFVLTFGFSFEYKGRDAFIDEIFIKESFRNRGIGNEPLKFLEEQAKKLGIKAIHLEVERGNKTGSKLYMKNGFTGNDRILRTKRIAEE